MTHSLTLVGTLLLATPLAFAQGSGQSSDGGRMPAPSGISAHLHGPDHGARDSDGRDTFEGGMHDHGQRDEVGGMHIPPGTWWRNPEFVSGIGLSPDQVKRIDSTFLESRVQLIHMHASLEEEQLRLEPFLAANPVNEQAAMAQISKIADTRADLEKANAKMLLQIRGVLTADQWAKLQQRPRGPRGMGEPGVANRVRREPTPNRAPAPPTQ